MNYLAHAYLSFGDEQILVGNMISDFVKGKKKFDFPQNIQNGITLHRLIDHFTDEHVYTKQAKHFFKSVVGLYAGAFVDVAYDHFLAKDESEFPGDSLKIFAGKTYAVLSKYNSLLPDKFGQMLPFMIGQDWLYNYSTLWGTEKSFGGLSRRAKYLQPNEAVFRCFIDNYMPLYNCYQKFFPALKEFAFIHYDKFVSA